jgi:murein L,D-transpeptidase YcbB/YkuD
LQWVARAQVGKDYRQTPVFTADLLYLVLNPTWTVPPTILAQDILPQVKKDITYLEKKNMTVLDRRGRPVDPTQVEWARYSGPDFPYALRQGPGPGNALGRVKFIFPNQHFVFLHDTPSTSLFEREERTFSSGCIRVEHPLELAARLLVDQDDWDRDRIDQVIASGKTQTVHLSEPLPVIIIYWTAFIDREDQLNFWRDVYGRDALVLAGLEGSPRPPQKAKAVLDKWGIGKPAKGN